jgi:hypothetical protein
VLVATGHTTGQGTGPGWILEVDPATDEVVWRLDFTSWTDGLYRAERIDGCAVFGNVRTCPALD